MSRRISAPALSVLLLAAGCGEPDHRSQERPRRPPAAQAVPGEPVAVESVPVSGSVHLLRVAEGDAGNAVASVGRDGVLLVDSMTPGAAVDLRRRLDELGAGPVRWVINTHFHLDHTRGNAVFSPAAAVVAHDAVRRRLTGRPAFGQHHYDETPPAAWPAVTFRRALDLHFNDERIRILHCPSAHTDGDAVVLFESSNVAALGDLFFPGRFPYIDLDYGGRVSGLIAAVESLLEILPPGARIAPGHGPVAGVNDLRRYREMLVETDGIIRERMEAGRTLTRIRAEGLPARWAGWSWSFVPARRWVEILYRSRVEEAAAP